MKRLILTLLISVSMICAYAQRERNYIYIVDCTKSMSGYQGKTPDIWVPTTDFLSRSIASAPDGSLINIVPFQNSAYPVITFQAKDYDAGDLRMRLDKYISGAPTNTNICDPWISGEKLIDPHRDNYLILLTDGVDSDNGRKERFKTILAEFCGKYTNAHGFYVKLTPNAAIDSDIRKLIEICDQLHEITMSDGIKPFGAFTANEISVNTLMLPARVTVPFSDYGTYRATVSCTDPHIAVTLVGDRISGGKATLELKSKYGDDKEAIYHAIGEPEYRFPVTVDCDGCIIANPEIEIDVTNKEERIITLAEAAEEETDLGKSDYYPAFLMCGAAGPDTLHLSLSPVLNDGARSEGAKAHMQVTATDGFDDYTLLIDGTPTPDGRFELGDTPVRLSIAFSPSTPQGKHYFDIRPYGPQQIDRINDHKIKDFCLRMRTATTHSMNPLLVALIWAGIIIVIALILWFLVIKPQMYPRIRHIGYITVQKPYYANIKVKGARKVILSDKAVRQSALNRLFTGPVVCKVNPVWTTPLVLERHGKGLRITGQRGAYVPTPYAASLTKPNVYTLTAKDGSTFEITVN